MGAGHQKSVACRRCLAARAGAPLPRSAKRSQACYVSMSSPRVHVTKCLRTLRPRLQSSLFRHLWWPRAVRAKGRCQWPMSMADVNGQLKFPSEVATSPNQVLTHAARAAAEQLNISATSGGRARRARRALVRARWRQLGLGLT